ncbi:YSIRK-type signal peptide-containing protein [Lactobacillus delbrueckii]|nr:YSIRK-type signal peptide-containing protein [Lactobacillus delbrueckii]MCD5527568.1 YSIRK-type signal peptide-containing protein [Lactobacillus delbrueckii subsp. lactis]
MNEPSSEKQRWSLRKISVGMTSVLLGATMF